MTDFNSLSPEEQREVAERILKIEESGWKPFWCPDAGCDGMPHRLLDANLAEQFVAHPADAGEGEVVASEPEEDGTWALLDPNWAHNHARVDQRLPAWNEPWTLFIMSGRGSGKTRTGVEFVTLSARRGLDGAILGRRGTELVNTHVATIITHAHPEFVPVHYASKDILVWPNGATTYLFSAEKPENIRSVNLSYFWVDEAAFMDEIETAYTNLVLATRIDSPENPIHRLVTSTPTPTEWVMKMEDDPEVKIRRVSTYANKANLSESFVAELEKNYAGTRIGRQEIGGEVLRDVEGALWNDDLFKHHIITDPVVFGDYLDSLDDVVLAVDPAGSAGKRSDSTGIIGAGARHFDDDGEHLGSSTFDVLVDATIKGTPTEWARQVFKAARLIRARRIVAEKNFGGDMVKQVLTDFARLHPVEARDPDGEEYQIKVEHAVKSKETRAEPAVGKYEQGRVTHIPNPTVFGDLSNLEKSQVTWVPKSRGGRMASPNEIDALVWALRELDTSLRHRAQTASPSSAYSKIRRRGGGWGTPSRMSNRARRVP